MGQADQQKNPGGGEKEVVWRAACESIQIDIEHAVTRKGKDKSIISGQVSKSINIKRKQTANVKQSKTGGNKEIYKMAPMQKHIKKDKLDK